MARMTCLWIAAAAVAVAALTTGATAGEGKGKLVPLKIDLPLPQFIGTKGLEGFKFTPKMEKPRVKPRPPFLAPEGTTNLALEKPVTSSDDEPFVGELEQVTDGDKSGGQNSYVEFAEGRQWVQIDLEAPAEICAIVVWHFHGQVCLYHDVVVQVADDADFITNVRTLFNNDYDNSSGLGIGKAKEYFEDYQGRLVPVEGVKARYVRLYSKGNTTGLVNRYTEVEVYGKPAQ